MKEIIKKVVISVLAVVIIIGVVVFALKGDDSVDVDQSTSGTSSGQTVSGENNTTSSADKNNVNTDSTTGNSQGQNDTPNQPQGTTDSQGQTAPSGNQGVQNPQPQQNTTTAANNPSQQSTQSQQGSTQNNTQSNEPSQPQQNNNTTSNNATPVVPVNPDQPQKVNKIDTYQNIFRGGKFLMKVNDPDLGPVTMAMSGNKMFVEASMEGLTLKMLYDGDKPDEKNPSTGTWYIVIDKIKKYSPMPADMIGDMNVEELTKDFAKGDSNTVYTTSYETVNGEQLECESCVDSNGNTTKYYFKGDQLVRSDSISPDGTVSTTEFQEITANVDDSLFTIPEGYAKWDISWLINMMG